MKNYPTKELLESLPLTDPHDPNPRLKWISMPKPWYWIFTFWNTKWRNYGEFKVILFDAAEYDSAPYEVVYIFR